MSKGEVFYGSDQLGQGKVEFRANYFFLASRNQLLSIESRYDLGLTILRFKNSRLKHLSGKGESLDRCRAFAFPDERIQLWVMENLRR